MKRFFLALRKYFIIFFTIFAYILLVYSLFISEYWRMSSFYLLLFFVFAPYFLIELRDDGLTVFLWIIIGVIIIFMMLIGFKSILKTGSLYILNIALILLLISMNGAINNRKQINSWGIFHSGVGIFSLFVALAFSMMFLVKHTEFDLSCKALYDGFGQFMMVISKPLRIPIDEVNKIRSNVGNLGNTKVKDVLGINGIADFQKDNVSDIAFIEDLTLSGDQLIGSGQQMIDLTGYNQLFKNYTGTIEKYGEGLLGKVDEFKEILVDKVIEDKRSIDTEVCSFMIQSIKKRYKDPTFKMSVIVLIFFLVWPFIRVIFFIIATINVILFKFLNLFRMYRIRLITDEVEEIV